MRHYHCIPFVTLHNGGACHNPDSEQFLDEAVHSTADFIELDVQILRSGYLMFSHDPVVFDDSGIPFQDALKFFSGTDKRINIDVKNVKALVPIAKLLKKTGYIEKTVLTGLSILDIIKEKQHLTGLSYMWNITAREMMKSPEIIVRDFLENRCTALNADFRSIDNSFLRMCCRYNIPVSLWTVDEKAFMQKRYAVYNITTNDIQLFNDAYLRSGEKLSV